MSRKGEDTGTIEEWITVLKCDCPCFKNEVLLVDVATMGDYTTWKYCGLCGKPATYRVISK